MKRSRQRNAMRIFGDLKSDEEIREEEARTALRELLADLSPGERERVCMALVDFLASKSNTATIAIGKGA